MNRLLTTAVSQTLCSASMLLALAGGLPALAQDAMPEQTNSAGTAAETWTQADLGVRYSSTLWNKGKYDVEGSYRIEQDADGLVLVLGRDFKTKKGPDLKAVLSPLTPGQATGKNALQGKALNLGLLSSHNGASRFRIPEGTELTQFKSLLIHCEEYSVLWGSAPLSEGEVIAHGHDWTKKTKKVTGTWEIAQTESGQVIRLHDDFKTSGAPDLKIVLSPLTVRAAKNNNALQGSQIISPLQSNSGAQEYAIPAGLDLSKYKSVLIHCEQYTKLWGAAPLQVSAG